MIMRFLRLLRWISYRELQYVEYRLDCLSDRLMDGDVEIEDYAVMKNDLCIERRAINADIDRLNVAINVQKGEIA